MSALDIAGRLGLSRVRTGWRGSCPRCGYKDTFALRDKNGRARGWCASCGDRDGIQDLLTELGGGASPMIAEWLPDAPEPSIADRVARAMKTWNGAVPAVGTPAEVYLTGRGLPEVARSPALRWRPDVRHPDTPGTYPAMLALIQDALGAPLAVHRHYLTRDGKKADLLPPKASVGPVRGGFVQLDPLAPEMVIGEGVESSASAGALFHLPALAAISAGNLERSLDLPLEVRSVVIAADNDPIAPNGRRPGQWAAHAAARRWTAQGRKVRVAVPDREGVDFNDLLQERLGVVLHHG